MPLSGKDLCRLFQKAGYEVVPGGKGSHIKMKKTGCPTATIPNHKELKNGTEHDLLKILKNLSKKGK